jgi:hypothetical protein
MTRSRGPASPRTASAPHCPPPTWPAAPTSGTCRPATCATRSCCGPRSTARGSTPPATATSPPSALCGPNAPTRRS